MTTAGAMPVRHTTPDLLVEGDTILDSRGREVVVDSRTADTLALRRGEVVHEVPLAKLPPQVVLVQSAAEAHERAVALAQVRLAGEVVGHREADGPYRVPERFPDLASWLAHAYLFHQSPERDPKVPASFPAGPLGHVMDWHHSEHARVLVVPHVHEPDFYRRAGVNAPAVTPDTIPERITT